VNLTFDAESHTYRVDGRIVPSVTQRLSAAGLGVDYGGVNPVVLEHARERGIHVEACCMLWGEGELDEDSVHPEATPYLSAYKRWVVDHRVENTRWQVVGFDAECDTAGTADILCEVDGVASVVDVKAVYQLSRTYRIQLTAYRRMHEGVRRRYVLQLKKTGVYVLVNCNAQELAEGVSDERAWLACVELSKWKAVA
jgi:hypothetical protein